MKILMMNTMKRQPVACAIRSDMQRLFVGIKCIFIVLQFTMVFICCHEVFLERQCPDALYHFLVIWCLSCFCHWVRVS